MENLLADLALHVLGTVDDDRDRKTGSVEAVGRLDIGAASTVVEGIADVDGAVVRHADSLGAGHVAAEHDGVLPLLATAAGPGERREQGGSSDEDPAKRYALLFICTSLRARLRGASRCLHPEHDRQTAPR
ncbi:MAG: hypothetical protein R2991_14000 [Thermoanaerobaculia bacterium]